MPASIKQDRANRRVLAIGSAALLTTIVLGVATTARAGSKPVGPLPPGPISTITTASTRLVAIALPKATNRSGLVWRLARRYDPQVVREISEADVGRTVVVVFKVVGRGTTSVIFALTRGDTSAKAVKAITHRIRSR